MITRAVESRSRYYAAMGGNMCAGEGYCGGTFEACAQRGLEPPFWIVQASSWRQLPEEESAARTPGGSWRQLADMDAVLEVLEDSEHRIHALMDLLAPVPGPKRFKTFV